MLADQKNNKKRLNISQQNNQKLALKSKQKQKQTPANPQKKSQKDASYWQQMINGIVRPPRAKYNSTQLGNKVVMYKQRMYVREDFSVNHQNKNLQLTLYKPTATVNNMNPYVILYMHGNSSCRLQSIGLIKYLPLGVALASFDFMGCGKNQMEETISLGYREAQQAKTICQYIRNMGYRVILWGRSMGAATAILYGEAQFIVADSSFKSFKSLCKQVAKQHTPVPNFMINCFFPCVFQKIKTDVDKKAHYDVQDLDVKEAVKNLNPNTVIVFMSGDKDSLINKRNSQKLYNQCPCQKKYLKIFDGDHNSKRPQPILIEIMKLIQEHIVNNQGIKPRIIEQPQIQLKLQ